MGLSYSKSAQSLLDEQVSKAMQSSPSSPAAPEVQGTEVAKNSFVGATESPSASLSATSPARSSEVRKIMMNPGETLSITSLGCPTESSRRERRKLGRRSPSPNRSNTSSDFLPVLNKPTSATSSAELPQLLQPPQPTAPTAPTAPIQITLPDSVFLTSESEFKGGYRYAAELSAVATEQPQLYNGGEPNIITLDRELFETPAHQLGGEVATSEFNPEKFFKDMQLGGLHEPRNKEYKKGHIEKMLSPEGNDDDEDKDAEDKFSFAETTEGLDVNSNEDTEDLKQKVKHLRMMVSRSTGKKSSKKSRKSKSRKAKRMTPPPEESESTGGADNSISEYVNSTSSISTSDVRLISMNKMRKR